MAAITLQTLNSNWAIPETNDAHHMKGIHMLDHFNEVGYFTGALNSILFMLKKTTISAFTTSGFCGRRKFVQKQKAA